jgi:predicted ATPase
VEAFSQRQVQVGEMVIQSDISDLFQAEHLVQKQKNHRAHTRVFLSDPLHRHSTNSRSDDERKQSNKDMTPLEQMEETIEDSLR